MMTLQEAQDKLEAAASLRERASFCCGKWSMQELLIETAMRLENEVKFYWNPLPNITL